MNAHVAAVAEMSRETRAAFATYLLHRMLVDSIDAETSPAARTLIRAHQEFVRLLDSSRAACLTAPAVSTTAEAREPISSGQSGLGSNQTKNITTIETPAPVATPSPVV